MKFILKSLQNIDNLMSFIFSNNANEKEYLIKKLKNKKPVCFDVGANLGGYLDFLAKSFTFKELHIFEPSKECVKFLNNKFYKKNYNIINQAVSDKNKLSLFYENEILSQSSLYKNKNKFNKNYNFSNKYKIKCISLDNYCKKFPKNFKIDILKIDAEGEDLNVLKGSKKLLKNKKIKLIKIELLNSIDKKNNSNLIEICKFLEKYNYYLSTIVKTKFSNNKLLMMDTYFEVL